MKTTNPHVLTALTFLLPPSIHSPYYVDIVGNVSTSRFQPSKPRKDPLSEVKSAKDLSRLDIFPRYPVLGGWNYTFEIGYQGGLNMISRKLSDGR
jgi:oligosaccharyltransferase complex subunit alpha (ribophorin I)